MLFQANSGNVGRIAKNTNNKLNKDNFLTIYIYVIEAKDILGK